jgi:general secretion pathway protein D
VILVTRNRKYDTGIDLRRVLAGLGIMLAILLVSACSSTRFENRPPAWADTLRSDGDASSIPEVGTAPAQAAVDGGAETPVEDPGFYAPGSGEFVRAPTALAQAREQRDGDIKLNFHSANLLEVVKVMLGDMLGVNYAVDPAVQGVVSMQTTRAMHRDDLLPTLELLLRMNNAALVVGADDLYRVVPLQNALAEVRAPQLGDSTIALPTGFSVHVVPLKYVGAEEMAQILDPLVATGNQLLRVDSARNLLILASAGGQLDRLIDTIEIFDVDRMAGMSVALFTPDYVSAATLAEDLDQLLADPQHGLMAGLLRFIVVDRLNGLIVVTPHAEHLAKVREWIRRLDRNTGDASPRLFVYRVQNGKAADLAEMLGRLFQSDGGVQPLPPVDLAPGMERTTIGDRPEPVEPRAADTTTPRRPVAQAAAREADEGVRIDRQERVQIIADEANNALLILARGTEYRQILAALKQLDVSPMQVLIEVTVAEVTLTDNLAFGVEWFFRNKFSGNVGLGQLDLGAAGIGPLAPGFSYALSNAAGTNQVVLNALATESNLSIISSPSLLVLNNEEATIQVGEEVPVSVQQQQATVDDSNIINSIEYRNTGVLLTVKPRVNSGGLVIMEVEQEVSQAPSTVGADPLTPRIRTRKINSIVAVNSGDTIILGGLIQDNRDRSESGVPWVHKLPFLGPAFGTKADNQDRTELIVLITPRAVSNSTAALQVTEEFRRRLQKLIPPQRTPRAAGSSVVDRAAPE